MSSKNQKAKGSKGAAAVAAPAGDQKQADIKRFTEIIEELSKSTPVQVSPHVKQAAPYLATALVYIIAAIPYLVDACVAVHKFVSGLPEKIIYAGLGFLVCFFGGLFPATIAAVEGWNMCGGHEAIENCKSLYKQAMLVQAASAEDDKKDEDGDGVADTKQMKSKDLILRKAAVVAKAADPETVSKCASGLINGWMAVLAILKIKFAKTVALSERIGEQMYRVMASKFEPAIEQVVPEEYKKWVPVAVRWICKAVALSIAWWIGRLISAVHSAIRGGLLFGKYLVEYLHEIKVLNFGAEKAYLDEAIGWGLALCGLFFQYSIGFSVPFPFSVLLWPVQLLETFVIWSVAAN